MNEDFEQMMKELREEYVKSIPAKLVDIEEHFKAQQWGELRNDFHKLKGTGRTYGIPEISVLCEAVEKICVKQQASVNLVVPPALELLKAIYARRLNQQEYPIENEAAFIEIRKISSAIP